MIVLQNFGLFSLTLLRFICIEAIIIEVTVQAILCKTGGEIYLKNKKPKLNNGFDQTSCSLEKVSPSILKLKCLFLYYDKELD